ncbi:hypothetical protein BDZ89DRAFT_1118424 [Hymenopellis radicata]|nr:hypothetical protein BDZ89DRAFT_1118424 [Hymenopellis radicata]
MKSTIFTTLLSLTLALASPTMKRASIDPVVCTELEKEGSQPFHGQISEACGVLQSACLATLTPDFLDIWSVPACVAAVTCRGTTEVLTLAQCAHPELEPANAPHLNYNIYAGMVGACAWDDGGCPVTFQNYVDFMYGTLSELGSDKWPESVDYVREYWWNLIVEWTATGDELPYMNFDDWLSCVDYRVYIDGDELYTFIPCDHWNSEESIKFSFLHQ